jgi:hypothetical protein
MALGSIFLLLALLLVVALFVARPLIAAEEHADDQLDEEASHWIAERERALDALAELDVDWQLGKVPEEIYAPQRQQLVAAGAEALRKLDSMSVQLKETPASQEGGVSDAQLEQLIAARRNKKVGGRK